MIESVRFQNFKALRDVEIKLERLTVLVGPNASGKTSVLCGLHCLSRLAQEGPSKVFSGQLTPQFLQSSGTEIGLRLELNGVWDSTLGSLALDISRRLGDRYKWSFAIESRWGDRTFRSDDPARYTSSLSDFHDQDVSPLAQALASGVFLHFDLERLAEPSYAEGATLRIASSGYGLASVLADMALTVPDDFQAVQAAVRAVVPGFQRMRLPRTNIRYTTFERVPETSYYKDVQHSNWGYEIVADFDDAPDIPAHALSEGTLIIVGLLTVLMGPSRPRLLLLDNIERGLHPKATGEFIGQIRKILEQYPDLQIVATTHSPYLLDHLDPREIRLTSLAPQAGVQCAPMTDHPEFEKWKNEMAPGEFWSMIGEDWIKDRKPAAHE